ncbi:hypothetical protein ABPG72_005836 [Tetrahymena utriculariae]
MFYNIQKLFSQKCDTSISNSKIQFVYSHLYTQIYDIVDPLSIITDIKVASKANLVFFSAGFEGISILNGSNNQLIFSLKSKEFLYALETTSDGNVIHKIFISKDDKSILLGNDSLGRQVILIKINYNNNSQELIQAASGIMALQSQVNVLTDDLNYMYGLDVWSGVFVYNFRSILNNSGFKYSCLKHYKLPMIITIYSLIYVHQEQQYLISRSGIALSISKKSYLKQNGEVDFSQFFNDISQTNINFSLQGITSYSTSFKSYFKNKESLIYIGVQALLCRYLFSLDIRSFEVYDYMKYYSQQQSGNNQNDWYKYIIDIIVTEDLDCFGQLTPFPKCQIKQEQVNQILIDLEIPHQKGQTFETVSEKGLNNHLISEVLFSDALGLIDCPSSAFAPCVGESISLFPYEIDSIQSYKEIKNSWCSKLRRFLNIDYAKCGFSNNSPLPDWLQFQNKNAIIILKGIPQIPDN